jgi:hypothetical protein
MGRKLTCTTQCLSARIACGTGLSLSDDHCGLGSFLDVTLSADYLLLGFDCRCLHTIERFARCLGRLGLHSRDCLLAGRS